MFPEKSYGLKTWDKNNRDINVSLLGLLAEEEDWILYAPYSDKSLLRNVLNYDLSRIQADMPVALFFVELTLNNQHQDVYVFMEKLNFDENSGEDVTGDTS